MHELGHIPPPQPARKVNGYKMPESPAGLLNWDFVDEQMNSARFFWLATSDSHGRPHVAPVWGIWFNRLLHFEGGPDAKWVRNAQRSGEIAVHLPNAEQVVIIYGKVVVIDDNDLTPDEWRVLDSDFQAKYAIEKGSPYMYVRPSKVMAWNGGDLQTMTRWIFG